MFTMLCMGWYVTAIIQQVTGVNLVVAVNSNSAVLTLILSFLASPSSTLISSSYHYLPVTLLGCGLLLKSLNRTYDIAIMDHEYAVQELRQEYGNGKWSIIKGGLMPIIIYLIGWVVSIWTDAGDGTGPRASSWVLLCTPPVGLLFGLYVQHAIYDAHLGIVKLSQLKYSDVMSKEE
ncbi:hypothetical protein FOZ63_025773 [Perkinsus olseni]|nr:hypothetical protein FOZ63_025773 [Perkinsus olseni]